MNHHVNPIFEAKAVYCREPCARTWLEDLELHLIYGWVCSTPDYFIMGRPVNHKDTTVNILNPAVMYPRDKWTCWHIYLYAGDVRKAWDNYPFALPYVSWERHNVPKIYPMHRVKRIIGC